MATVMHGVPIDSLYAADTLFGEYAANPQGTIAGILGRFDAASSRWSGHAAPARRGGEAREAFFSGLAQSNRALGVRDDVVERLAAAGSGGARVAITGQQPGVLGGPLMSLYKIETAVALAARYERDHGEACVPVYWMGADDADFAEIRELVMLDASLRPLVTSLPSGAHEVGQPVGDISSDWLRRLWDGLDAFVGGFDGAGVVTDAMAAALAGSDDHAGVTARIVVALTGGAVAVVDAREPGLRRAASGLILEYFDREEEIKADVAAQGASLESSGFHAQLSLGPDSGVFVLEGGRRTKVARDHRAQARRRIADDPGIAFPGVVLRNLIQDVVFDPVATVLGPAEIAYRAQIRPVYDRLDVEPPVAFPRLFATYLPPAIAGLVREVGADPLALVTAPDDVMRAAFASRADGALEEARARFEGAFTRERDAFVGTIDGAMDGALVGKTRKRLDDVARRLTQALGAVDDVARARALERWPFLESLPEVLKRRGAPQERYLSMLAPLLFSGHSSDACVRDVARGFVDAAMDGRVEHIVYSD